MSDNVHRLNVPQQGIHLPDGSVAGPEVAPEPTIEQATDAKLAEVEEKAEEVYSHLAQMIDGTVGFADHGKKMAKSALAQLEPFEAALLADLIQFNTLKGFKGALHEVIDSL